MSTIARTAAHSVPAHCPPAHCLLDRSLPHRARMHMVWISYEHTRGACLCRRTHGPDKEQPHQGQPDLHRPGTEWAGPAMFQGNSRDDSCCTTDGRSTWLCSRAYRPAPALCRFRQRLPQWTRRAPFVSFKHTMNQGYKGNAVSLCALDVSNRTTRTRTRQHELKREHELVVYCFGSNFSNSVIGVLSR